MRIILASSSPRRKELLSLMGVDFETIVAIKDEDMAQKMSITKLSKSLSKQKAQEVFEKTTGDRIVIGSDTMVYIGKKLMGKPHSDKQAFDMIKALQGKWHKVITGLCVLVEKDGKKKEYLTFDITKVRFCKLCNETIKDYLTSHDQDGKAGAYAIQGKSGMFIEKINGNYSTVVGLPTHILYKILKNENILK